MKQFCDEEMAKCEERLKRQEDDFRRAISTRAEVDGKIRPLGDGELDKLFITLRLAIQMATYKVAHPFNLGKARGHTS